MRKRRAEFVKWTSKCDEHSGMIGQDEDLMDELLGKAATEEGDAPFWWPAAAVFLFMTEPNPV